MSHVLGIDISTTATKAVVVDASGNVVSSAESSYDYEVPQPLWAEQHPGLWWEAATTAVRSAVAEAGADPVSISGVGLTGQMHGSVLLDETGDVVRPALLWNDQRTAAECDEIRARVGCERLIDVTGNDALTGLTAPKLLWVRNHEPENWARVAHVLLPKDYVRLQLTGDFATDVAGGSGTGLFELAQRTWSDEILSALDLERSLFPPTHEGPSVTGNVTRTAAEATGLAEGTPVVAGGGDQAANAVGLGAVDPDVVAMSLGTSGVVFASTLGPTIDPAARVQAFCHAVPDRWHMMGVMLSAAGSLRWLRDAIAPGTEFSVLVEAARTIPPGSDGLIFLPYLSGERTPHPDPLARGAFVGLTNAHDLRHMTRAVLEGVAFGLRDGLDLMIEAGLATPSGIRASGGGVRSGLWRQILADVLETDIYTVGVEEGAAYGAALLAGVQAGFHSDVPTAVGSVVSAELSARPGDDVSRYRETHALFRDLYPALRPTFHALD